MSRLLIVCILLLSACATHRNQALMGPVDTGDINQLRNLQQQFADKKKKGELSQVRNIMLRDTALSLGARAGLAEESHRINEMLQGQAQTLDRLYNFRALLLKDNILPPVIVAGARSLHQHSAKMLRLADKNYTIMQQARFVTAPPTWREYLTLNFTRPEPPHNRLLPRSAAEQKVWADAIVEGWQKGQHQALEIYRDNLARLKRDYEGMIRYKELLQQKMVSLPQVTHQAMGVTGGGDKLNINDRTLTITADPALNPDAQKWRPVM